MRDAPAHVCPCVICRGNYAAVQHICPCAVCHHRRRRIASAPRAARTLPVRRGTPATARSTNHCPRCQSPERFHNRLCDECYAKLLAARDMAFRAAGLQFLPGCRKRSYVYARDPILLALVGAAGKQPLRRDPVHGWPVSSVARALGITPAAAQERLRRLGVEADPALQALGRHGGRRPGDAFGVRLGPP